MAELAKNIIKSSYLGYPVMLGEMVGRIVGYSEDGSWGEINGVKLYSILNVGTPHGTIIKSGCVYLDEITPEGLEKLESYEDELSYKLEPMYNGLLDDVLPKDKETYTAKLRNSLGPLYSLSQMIVLMDEHPDKKEEMWTLIIESAKLAESKRGRIDKLLTLIENKA